MTSTRILSRCLTITIGLMALGLPLFFFAISAPIREEVEAESSREVADAAQLDKNVSASSVSRSPRITPENEAWGYVAAARSTGDEKLYREALKIAHTLENAEATRLNGMLIRGHILHQMHRFHEARLLAAELVELRGMHCDHGFLGDVLLDIGDIDGAIGAYQQQMSLRPGLEAYARAAQVRWMKGQCEGAIDAMKMAANAGTTRNPEPLAWVLSTLALYQFQVGARDDALATIDAALEVVSGYPRALTVKGRILMATGHNAKAKSLLSDAAAKLPEPAVLWLLADCLVQTGESDRAVRIGQGIVRRGAKADPRTLSLYLATHRDSARKALALAQEEFESRQDIYTHDAIAWAALAVGDIGLAVTHMQHALAQGTQDARLFLHAGIIAEASGDAVESANHLRSANALRHMLQPSELQRLDSALSSLESRELRLSQKTES